VKTYTYSEARQRLAALLDRARREGRVQIRRRDGQLFVLQPAKPERSPLDVPGVRAKLRRGEIMDWLRASREDSATRLLEGGLSVRRMRPTKVRRRVARRTRRKQARPRPRG